MVTGLDLVALQIRLARGEGLEEVTQDSTRRSGHAIECRLYAENPAMNFLPSPGMLKRFRLPAAERGLRIDSGVREGDAITFHYDPMIAKLIAHADSRDAAIERMRACLGALEVEGVATNAAFLGRVLAHPAFRAGDVHTGFVSEHGDALLKG
jgi:3-methylcrotonyl-CoA carboxylase alpha subunit